MGAAYRMGAKRCPPARMGGLLDNFGASTGDKTVDAALEGAMKGGLGLDENNESYGWLLFGGGAAVGIITYVFIRGLIR